VKRAEMKSRYRYTGPSADVVEACLERAAYACEINGCELRGDRGEGWSLQHRMPRGEGGTASPRINLPSNLLVACGSGTTGCHGLIENQLRREAYVVGWLLRKCVCPEPFACEHSPRRKQTWILRDRWVYLTDGATYAPAPPPEVS
jgi:hypothetical protein